MLEFTNSYEMMHAAWSSPIVFQGHPSNFKVTRDQKIADFDPNWVFPDSNFGLNSLMAMKWCKKTWCNIEEVPYSFKSSIKFQGHTGQKWGGWGCEVSRGGHHRERGKTSALDGVVLDFTQILAYLVHNKSRSQLYLGFRHFGWLPSFFSQ